MVIGLGGSDKLTEITYRRASQADLAAIIHLLADDQLGAEREVLSDPIDERYLNAFLAIEADQNQLLAVAEKSGTIIGCLQLSFIPGLSRTGMWRGMIESVRITKEHRGEGVGHDVFRWAIEECRQRGCGLVQLTSDKLRPDALRFYDSLGFVASHEGLKLSLNEH